MRLLLVANPTARTGRAQQRIEDAKRRLESRGPRVEFLSTLPQGRTVAALEARLRTGPVDLVIAMGGDGTFAEVAKGIMAAGSPCAMALIPSGTANDQAKSLGISTDPEDLNAVLEVILAGHLLALDVGRVERLGDGGAVQDADYFFDCVGWGMQADVLKVRNEDREIAERIPLIRELYRDQVVYAGAALNRYLASWVEPTKFGAEVIVDGQPHHLNDLTDIIVNGTAVYAGAWILDRRSRPDDGLMELVPMVGRREMFSKGLRDLMAVPVWQEDLDVLGLEHSRSLSGKSFELSFRRPGRPVLATQIDGEEWKSGRNFRVEVLRGQLQLVTPAEFRPPWSSPSQ